MFILLLLLSGLPVLFIPECVGSVHGSVTSYKIKIAFILLSFIVLICGYILVYFYSIQSYVWLIFFPVSFAWFISCLAKTTQIRLNFEHSSFKSSYCIQSRTDDLKTCTVRK